MSRSLRTLLPCFPVMIAACSPAATADSADAEACAPTETPLPLDTALVALARTTDGRAWAVSDLGRTWIDEGRGWTPGPDLGWGPDRGLVAVGTSVWTTDGEALFHSDGGAWQTEAVDRPDEAYVERLAALDSGALVLATAAVCDDCEEVHVELRVGTPGAWSTTDLGTLDGFPAAIAAHGETALVTVGATAWTWDGAAWSDSELPDGREWTAAAAAGDGWVLAGFDGEVVRGQPGAWVRDEAALGFRPATMAATAADDVWVAGSDDEGGGAAAHDGGDGFAPVPVSGSWIAALLADGAGRALAATPGPALLSGDAAGLAPTWTTPHFMGGVLGTGPAGVALVASTDGQLSTFDGATWTVLDTGRRWWSAAAGCEDVAFALSDDGTLARWDGAALTYVEGPAPEGAEWFWTSLAVTDDCTPVIAGTVMDDDGGLSGRVAVADGDGWRDLPWPEGASGPQALAAADVDTITLATESGTWVGDGAAWTEVTGLPGRVTTLVRGPDGVWAGVTGDADEVGRIDGGAYTTAAATEGRVVGLLADGDGVDVSMSLETGGAVARWDGGWTSLGETTDTGWLYRDGDGGLWLVEVAQVAALCPPEG